MATEAHPSDNVLPDVRIRTGSADDIPLMETGFRGRLGKKVTSIAKNEHLHRIEIGIISGYFNLQRWYAKRGFFFKGTSRFKYLPFSVTFIFLNLSTLYRKIP